MTQSIGFLKCSRNVLLESAMEVTEPLFKGFIHLELNLRKETIEPATSISFQGQWKLVENYFISIRLS
jgi:hypothetical protein